MSVVDCVDDVLHGDCWNQFHSERHNAVAAVVVAVAVGDGGSAAGDVGVEVASVCAA